MMERKLLPVRVGNFDTIQCLYEGKEELFGGLDIIYAKWDWEKARPVIMLDFLTSKPQTAKDFRTDLFEKLNLYNLLYEYSPGELGSAEEELLLLSKHDFFSAETEIANISFDEHFSEIYGYAKEELLITIILFL